MKMFLLTVSIILLVGCAYHAEGDFLRKSDSVGEVIYKEKKYYVVKVTDLKRGKT